MAKMDTNAVRQIGSRLQGAGNEVGQLSAEILAGGSISGAFASTPLAASGQAFDAGVAQLAESANKYHDYLTAFGQSLISAAASYQKIDQHMGHAFASVEDQINQAAATIPGFVK